MVLECGKKNYQPYIVIYESRVSLLFVTSSYSHPVLTSDTGLGVISIVLCEGRFETSCIIHVPCSSCDRK